MGIRANFTQADVERRFRKFLEEAEKKQIERMQYLGEACVKHAKLIPPSSGFTDQTGNLRSSIGYAVFKDGVAVHVGYEKVLSGSDGTNAGKNLAKQIANKHPKGILLVVTAGMNYAAVLESKGKDVLTSAEKLAEKELPNMIKKLTENINNALR